MTSSDLGRPDGLLEVGRFLAITNSKSRELVDLPVPDLARGGVIVGVQAAPVLSYLQDVIEGRLGYLLPPAPFVPGTNGIGMVKAVGHGVRHFQPGQRVLLDPHLVVNENVREPAQILIGLTATRSSRFGGIADATRALQADWRHGTFAEMVHMPVSVLTAMPKSLESVSSERLVVSVSLPFPTEVSCARHRKREKQ